MRQLHDLTPNQSNKSDYNSRLKASVHYKVVSYGLVGSAMPDPVLDLGRDLDSSALGAPYTLENSDQGVTLPSVQKWLRTSQNKVSAVKFQYNH